MADWQFARNTLTAPKSRQRVRLAVTTTGPQARNPWNLEDRFGGYTTTWSERGNIFIHHATRATPPYEFMSIADSSGDAVDPRIAMDPRGVLHLTYARSTGDAYRRESWDEGKTWTEEEVAITGGSHPTQAFGIDGTHIVAAYVAGNIVATERAAGDTAPSAPFTFEDDAAAVLVVEDDTFHIQEGRESPGRWLLTVVIDGETATSDWGSNDGGRTWTRF